MAYRKQWIHDLGDKFGSLAELARVAGLAYAHLNSVANGRRELSPGMLATLAGVAWAHGHQGIIPRERCIVAWHPIDGAGEVAVTVSLAVEVPR
jgi:hypothetical protein